MSTNVPYQRLDFAAGGEWNEETGFGRRPAKSRSFFYCGLLTLFVVLVGAGTAVAVVLLTPAHEAETEPEPPAEPTDSQPPADYRERALWLFERAPLIDSHNDWPWELRMLWERRLFLDGDAAVDPLTQLQRLDDTDTDLYNLKDSRVSGQFWSVWVPCSPAVDAPARVAQQIDLVHRMIANSGGVLRLATSTDDFAALPAGTVASFLGVEGGHAVSSTLGQLRQLYAAGVRYMTLTHTCNTPWAQSSPSEGAPASYDGPYPAVRGLTGFGRSVVHEMNRIGMMVDISHVAEQTMKDVLAVAKAPVIFSHSNARALCDYHRNVPDAILDAVKVNRGVVQVTFFGGFVNEAAKTAMLDYDAKCGTPSYAYNCSDVEFARWARMIKARKIVTLGDVVKQIVYIRDRIGAEHVGIGSDFDGSQGFLPVGLDSVARYPDLFAELYRQNFTTSELMGIAGGNLLRVLGDVEDVAAALQATESVPPAQRFLTDEMRAELAKENGGSMPFHTDQPTLQPPTPAPTHAAAGTGAPSAQPSRVPTPSPTK